jgi:hypothetical protein
VLSEKQDEKFKDGFVVFNPLGWERSELVALDSACGPVQVRDLATNTIVPQQTQSAGRILFEAKSVPPFGYRTYQIEAAPQADPDPSLGQDAMIENSYYRVEVRRSDGAIVGIYDKELTRQLVDPDKQSKPGQLLRSQQYKNLPLDRSEVTIEVHGGSLIKELVVRRYGSYWPETRISLPTDQKLVKIRQHRRSREDASRGESRGRHVRILVPFQIHKLVPFVGGRRPRLSPVSHRLSAGSPYGCGCSKTYVGIGEHRGQPLLQRPDRGAAIILRYGSVLAWPERRMWHVPERDPLRCHAEGR